MSLIESRSISPPETPLAYDIRHDINRFKQLKNQFGETQAREILSQEMAVDLLHHFAELENVKFFSYRYLINSQNQLVEDTPTQSPVRKFFENSASPETLMWLNQMIPFLETAQVGQSAFTISAKNPDSDFENSYDFAYFFHKISDTQISCFGLQLNLTPAQQALILNKFLDSDSKLPHSPSWNQVRQTALYFPPSQFSSPSQAFLEILENKLFQFSSASEFDQFKKNQQTWFEKKRQEKEILAQKITNMIADGFSPEKIQKALQIKQMEIIKTLDLSQYRKEYRNGELYLLLPCGAVSLGESFGYLTSTMGENLLSEEWKLGDCRVCGTKNTHVGPCCVCRSCQAKFDQGLIV